MPEQFHGHFRGEQNEKLKKPLGVFHTDKNEILLRMCGRYFQRRVTTPSFRSTYALLILHHGFCRDPRSLGPYSDQLLLCQYLMNIPRRPETNSLAAAPATSGSFAEKLVFGVQPQLQPMKVPTNVSSCNSSDMVIWSFCSRPTVALPRYFSTC